MIAFKGAIWTMSVAVHNQKGRRFKLDSLEITLTPMADKATCVFTHFLALAIADQAYTALPDLAAFNTIQVPASRAAITLEAKPEMRDILIVRAVTPSGLISETQILKHKGY
ncbi:hypothetical protein M501DRAFT_684120 [Patellaria atrata CBS 101060]|uniref:Uncharacterized protein n=1 Tax=Patellaria atrata CBS 101060 TaxID=1346257 RepID=A0A9P4SCV5_9PEZI|nr:hypothetical protein M501DRAFT_684120 [Patellaria atrata CBS 101060]